MIGEYLAVHAEPHVDESPTSWLLRTAQAHGLSINQLLLSRQVGWARDLDVRLTAGALDSFTKRMQFPLQPIRMMTKLFDAFRDNKWPRVWLRSSPRKEAETGYCPRCLQEDKHPYWRATWRFKYWVICPLHSLRILKRCAACTKPIRTADYRASLPAVYGLTQIVTCVHCHADLRDAPWVKVRCSRRARDVIADLQQAITAALVKGCFRIDGVDEDIPLALLPAVLVAGGCRLRPSFPVQAAFVDELMSAIRNLEKGGEEGFFVSRKVWRNAPRSHYAWRADTATLATKALRQCFAPYFTVDDPLEPRSESAFGLDVWETADYWTYECYAGV